MPLVRGGGKDDVKSYFGNQQLWILTCANKLPRGEGCRVETRFQRPLLESRPRSARNWNIASDGQPVNHSNINTRNSEGDFVYNGRAVAAVVLESHAGLSAWADT